MATVETTDRAGVRHYKIELNASTSEARIAAAKKAAENTSRLPIVPEEHEDSSNVFINALECWRGIEHESVNSPEYAGIPQKYRKWKTLQNQPFPSGKAAL